MAKVTKTIGEVLKLIIMLVVGVLVFLFLRGQYLKTAEEKSSDKEFKKKGLFKSLGDWLIGENTASADSPTRDEAIKDAQQEVEDIQNKIEDRDKKALEETQKIVNLDDSDFTKVLEEKKREIENRETKPNEKFDRTSSDIKIFRFKKPIKSKTGIKVTDFAFFNKSSENAEERKARSDEAKKQAKEAGFSLGRDQAGRETTPIHTLISSDDRITRFKQQLEASQRRRLGERKVATQKKTKVKKSNK